MMPQETSLIDRQIGEAHRKGKRLGHLIAELRLSEPGILPGIVAVDPSSLSRAIDAYVAGLKRHPIPHESFALETIKAAYSLGMQDGELTLYQFA